MAQDASGESVRPSNYPRVPKRVPTASQQTAERIARQTSDTEQPQKAVEIQLAITDKAKTHRTLATNPFSEEGKTEATRLAFAAQTNVQRLAEGVSTVDEFDAISHVLLDEPEGEYERRFYALQTRGNTPRVEDVEKDPRLARPEFSANRKKERQMLWDEMVTSAYMTVDLVADVQTEMQKGNMDWYMQPGRTNAEIYARLSRVAFQTEDYDTIQANFSKDQRLGYRLSILNFIRDLDGLKTFQGTVLAGMTPDVQAATILGLSHDTFKHAPQVRITPMGFILELSNADYAAVSIAPEKSLGTYINGALVHQPPQTWNSVILINRDRQNPTEPGQPTNQRQASINHEIAHAIFSKFSKFKLFFDTFDSQRARQRIMDLQPEGGLLIPAQEDDLSYIEGEVDFRLEKFLNESLAYSTAGYYPENLSESAMTGRRVMQTLFDLTQSPTMTHDVWNDARREYDRYFRLLRAGRTIMSQVLAFGKIPPRPHGRQEAGKVDKFAFFTAVFSNDTGKNPLLRLQRYSQEFLGVDMRHTVEGTYDARDDQAKDISRHLGRYAGMKDRALAVAFHVTGKEANKATDDMKKLRFVLTPSLLPGAIQWLRSRGNFSQKNTLMADMTRYVLTSVDNILFLYQDTPSTPPKKPRKGEISTQQVQEIQETIAGLTISPADKEMMLLLARMREKTKELLAIRNATFN